SQCYADHRDLHSFPTRRSSDLELGEDIIHSVTNPIGRLTGAIHIYGGDFFGVQRSEWDAETFLERACDGDRMARRFEQANTLARSEEHTSELQSLAYLVCRLLL